MIKKPYQITVRGNHREWVFDVMIDPEYLQDWIDDGLYINEGPVYRIPMWAAKMGLARAWMFVSDVWNFRNPLK